MSEPSTNINPYIEITPSEDAIDVNSIQSHDTASTQSHDTANIGTDSNYGIQ